MMSRGTVIAALLAIELAVVGEAVVAVRGDRPARSATQRAEAPAAPGARLIEDGPHQIFDTGPKPTLTVDIGYADLTILTGKPSQIDVSLSGSSAFGAMRETAPIAAREDGATVRIAKAGDTAWSVGDDRMVTVLVPPETTVTVVDAGDIKATGLRAEASFKSVGRGSVVVEDYDGPKLLASAGGKISLHGIVAANLDATSSDGRVEGTALQVHDGSVDSDGSVMLGFAPGADTQVTADTSSGSINASSFASTTPLETRHKGDDGSDDTESSESVRVGAGHGHLDVHSSGGNITLAQEN